MVVTSIILGTAFLIGGILFSLGRLHIYLDAWQAMTPQERAQIKIKPLCRNIGRMISIPGMLFIVNGLSEPFRAGYFVPAMVLWLVLACVDVWYIGKNNRYQY